MTRRTIHSLAVALALLAATPGCMPSPAASDPAPLASAQDAFWRNLQRHCRQTFGGRIVQRPPEDRIFTGNEELIAHFRECGEAEIRIPFHVGADRSRTWVLRRTQEGLELRHDHRHEDGTPAENTWYGASTVAEGSANQQDFVNATPEGGSRGWRIEIEPGRRYTYGTTTDGAWRYRLDFDASRPLPEPPPPWGSENSHPVAYAPVPRLSVAQLQQGIEP